MSDAEEKSNRNFRKVPIKAFTEALAVLKIAPNELAYKLGYSGAGTALGWQKSGEFPMPASLALKHVLAEAGVAEEKKPVTVLLTFEDGKTSIVPMVGAEKTIIGGKEYLVVPFGPKK